MISYDSKRFECEVCEKPYPKCIYIDNKRYDIFLSLPNTPYLLIENVIREKKKSKGIILIKMDQLTMKDPNIEIKLVGQFFNFLKFFSHAFRILQYF